MRITVGFYARNPALGLIFKKLGRKHNKKVDPHTLPGQCSDAADPGLDQFARNLKFKHITKSKAEGFSQTLLNGSIRMASTRPMPFD